MDFLKWESDADQDNKRSSRTFSFMQDNISNLWEKQPADTSSIHSNDRQESSQLSDLLVEKLISMALPPPTEIDAEALQGRVNAGRKRPNLSVQIMSKNFIMLNSRLSYPFELIDEIIKVFSWENPFQTLTLLLLYTHAILNPLPMLSSLPFFLIAFYIMTPAYYNIHFPDQNTVLGKGNPIIADGPQLMSPILPKPAPQFSKEFILNLTDLQNHMLLYVTAWDKINELLTKFAFFINASNSSFSFLLCLVMGTGCMLFSNWIPVKFLLLFTGWFFTILFHPYFFDYLCNLYYSEDTRLKILKKSNRFEEFIDSWFHFDEQQEQREVEMFEIQKYNQESKQWDLLFFINDDFSKMSKTQIYNTKGVGSKNEIKPPKNWEFFGDDWKIDLSPENWVKLHLLTGKVRIDEETKWVYDIADEENHFKPQFRRRRWTRSVTRETIATKNKTK